MDRHILATAAIVTLATIGTANAADMAAPAPVYKAPASPPPTYSWTGCYVGGGGGYGMWNQDSFVTGPGGATVTANTTNGGRGWFGMVQGGCDYQFTAPIFNNLQVVIGAFGDYNFDDITGNLNTGGSQGFGNEKESSAWAAGGRIGVLITPKFLSYFDGGYTQTRFDQVNFQSYTGTIGASLGTNIGATTYDGWFLGSGFEYAFDFLPIPGLFLKTEYRYSSFDWANVPITGAAGFGIDSRKYTQTISTELIWRFNWFGQ